ncbi:MAG TPA: cytochrome c oxidase subunit II [Egibacteraceae bacterium]|nr:cytochrome c oxidase subunit II [Egibacteraceae bacterium]
MLVAGLALVLAACASEPLPQSALDPAGPVARQQDRLWDMVVPIAAAVFVLVEGGILLLLWRYRGRGDDRPPKQVAGNTRLEIVWPVIPALLLTGVAVPTVATIFALSGRPAGDPLEVKVVGKQYWWEFEYLGPEGRGVVTANELHIPTERPVFIRLDGTGTDADVIHSFWVPRLAGKQDYIPGHVRTMHLEADEPGVYPGQCAEFCGLSHANMRLLVVAHEPAEFRRWLSDQARPARSNQTGLAAQGREVVTTAGCLGCHTIAGHPDNADVRVGPDLTHFASRQRFAGAIFDNDDPAQLAAWLRDPQAVKPGAQMPNLQLSAHQIEALVAYLQSLE